MPAVTLINALPNFVSPEEHRVLAASTPTSFNDIPPVLRHQEPNVAIKLDPAVDGFTDADAAQGTLFVLTSVLAFMSTTGRGFQIEYPAITLHAISRGEKGPSIYCQLDENVGAAVVGRHTGEDEEEDTELRELTILPQNPASLDRIFECLSICAALHPDKRSPEDEEDPDDAFIDSSTFETFTGDQEQELSEVGRAALAHVESIIYDPHDTTQTNGVGGDEGEDGPSSATETRTQEKE
ncbi:Methylosome subunit pICln [Hypsizygus marmoreus]|uniref:Methylosome subunit pICln n=1 Tax=Hypsizygus marmoreus TaxID=39966 RepID=A0A369K494_HYPMA|nr:Methylosome subunit pICln [Hypsizygus marmoreus]